MKSIADDNPIRPAKTTLLLIAFEGCEDRNQASLFRNKILYGKSTETPLLPEGEYYHHQLIGLQVLDVNRQTLGEWLTLLIHQRTM